MHLSQTEMLTRMQKAKRLARKVKSAGKQMKKKASKAKKSAKRIKRQMSDKFKYEMFKYPVTVRLPK